MEDAARYADQIVIMQQGKVVKKGTPEEIFSAPTELVEMGLDVPEVVRFQLKLEEKLGIKLEKIYLTIDELSSAVAERLSRGDQLMMEKMIFGRYVPADSIIHRMDPRSKLTDYFLICMCYLFSK